MRLQTKRILWIQTGGTIACSAVPAGLAPATTPLDMPGFSYDVITPFTLDSTDINPSHWLILARAVSDDRYRYSGFVITHGTDTMQYTAAALSLMLYGFDKPVILTGAMKPSASSSGSDAASNLHNAFTAAQNTRLRGVYVAFAGRLIPGISCVKVNSTDTDAFADTGLVYDGGYLGERLCEKVFCLKAVPGMSADITDWILSKGYRGVVCEAYGQGGIPPALLEGLGTLVRNGVRVIAVSRCLYGGTDLNIYAAHKKARKLGLEAWSMTGSAALVRLMLELGQSEQATSADGV